MMAAAKTTSRDLAAELAFVTRALKAPTLREAVPRLAERARAESWSHEEFLVACLQREVSARESHGGEGRIRAARFPARKSLEEFDFDHARGLRRDVIAHLGTLDFAAAKENVIFLGPPGTGKTHLAIGLAVRAWQAGPATRCWSSTRSATSRSQPGRPACSSSSYPPATSAPASSSPATSRSAAGARSSATKWSPPR
jgi:DNA replication protein DnaC